MILRLSWINQIISWSLALSLCFSLSLCSNTSATISAVSSQCQRLYGPISTTPHPSATPPQPSQTLPPVQIEQINALSLSVCCSLPSLSVFRNESIVIIEDILYPILSFVFSLFLAPSISSSNEFIITQWTSFKKHFFKTERQMHRNPPIHWHLFSLFLWGTYVQGHVNMYILLHWPKHEFECSKELNINTV